MENTPPPYIETPEKQFTPPPALSAKVNILVLPVVLLVGIGIGYLLWGRAALQGKAQAAVQPTPAATADNSAAAGAQTATQQTVTRYDVSVDDDPILGLDSAEITLIEFSDYECPFCTQWQQEVFPRLMQEYGDKIRFVYRDFPLYGLHANAAPAAEAANCAGEQDKYWEYHNLLFSSNSNLGTETFQKYAAELGLDTVKFDDCVTSHRTLAEIEADYEFATNLGIRSTPTFFINGLALVGAQPYEVFKNVIDKELAGEIP